MPCAKALMSPPMYSFGLGGERVRDAKITTQAFSHLYGFKDQAIPETNLPSCIAQVIAVPTSPGVAALSANSCSTLRRQRHTEERSRSAEVPAHPNDWKYLII